MAYRRAISRRRYLTSRHFYTYVDIAGVLERVDAVFVTVEPKGGSVRPSTKRLLFAYLDVGANHP